MPAPTDLRQHLIDGRGRVVDASLSYRAAARPCDLLIGDVTPDMLRLLASDSVVLGTSVFQIAGACLFGEAGIMTEDTFRFCHQLNTYASDAQAWTNDYRSREARLRRIDIGEDVVLLAGLGHTVYGHWIADFLPKLYLLHRCGLDIDRLRFLMPSDTPAFARNWLSLVGIGDGQLVRYDRQTDVVACRTLIVPTALRFGSRASPLMKPARRFLLSRLDRNTRFWTRIRGRKAERRLFVSRSRTAAASGRQLVERAALEDMARARGFEIVCPETLAVSDQIDIFRGASKIVGEYGSGLHASILSEPGSIVLSVLSLIHI